MPIKILHVLNGLGSGGAEAIIMNWYRHIDKTKIQFDFLIRSTENIYAEEIRNYGGQVYIMPPYPGAYFANRTETEKFFREHSGEYKAIHVHGNALLYVNIFKIAKKSGVQNRIFHSHSIQTSPAYLILHIFNRFRIQKLATHYFACSDAAGKWAFRNGPFIIINNGIITERFCYNVSVRTRMRQELGLQGKVVYGHVGRFAAVKNHVFLLEVFGKLAQKKKESVLLLLGEGELQEKIKQIAEEKGIGDKVLFLGRKSNVGNYFQAMDVFLLPSLHEGFPIVAVEAQGSGLRSVLSDTIPNEVAITELVTRLPISNSDVWVEYLMNLDPQGRRDTTADIQKAGYDIKKTTKYLEAFYCSLH